MKALIKLNGIPLLTEEQCQGLFSTDDWGGDYLMKPIYRDLSDTSDLSESERKNYRFKELPDELYLVGLVVVSDDWVNKGFCGSLFETYGLVLDEAHPITKKEKNNSESMMQLTFGHAGITRWPYMPEGANIVITNEED